MEGAVDQRKQWIWIGGISVILLAVAAVIFSLGLVTTKPSSQVVMTYDRKDLNTDGIEPTLKEYGLLIESLEVYRDLVDAILKPVIKKDGVSYWMIVDVLGSRMKDILDASNVSVNERRTIEKSFDQLKRKLNTI